MFREAHKEFKNDADMFSTPSVGYTKKVENEVLQDEERVNLTAPDTVDIGVEGVGTLTIADRARVSVEANPEQSVRLAVGDSAKGTLIVDGGSSATKDPGMSSFADFSARQLIVGLNGPGILTISGGGSLTADRCFWGYLSSAKTATLVTGKTGGGYRSNRRVADFFKRRWLQKSRRSTGAPGYQ